MGIEAIETGHHLERNLAQPLTVAKAGPVIEILDPPVKLTRSGAPSFRLRTATKIKEIVGKISSPADLKSLKINQQSIQPGEDGIFKSEIPIDSASTTVKIIATATPDAIILDTSDLDIQQAFEAAVAVVERLRKP